MATTPARAHVVYDLLRNGAAWPQCSPIDAFELERPRNDEPEGGDAVVTTGAFESEEAFRAAADAARELGATPDGLSDLEVKPRQVHFILSR
ncbi:MAG: hypothetical protein H0T69_09475 [Thermoleophilaceae bacterium]|nr:hypothetical protein [Thermoleophilaceae bacterium]